VSSENAKIVNTFLGREDHGIFTASLSLAGNGWGQGFGNYSLDGPGPDNTRVGHGFGIDFIAGVLTVLGVERWEKLPGTHCRVRREGGLIVAIGHIVEERWFEPRALASAVSS
jgi:hypothetical protein